MSDEWVPAPAADIKVGDQTRIDNEHGGWNWRTITAVGFDGDNIVIYLGDQAIVYPASAHMMVRTAEDRVAVERRQEARMATLCDRIKDDSEPWYLKLINRFVS